MSYQSSIDSIKHDIRLGRDTPKLRARLAQLQAEQAQAFKEEMEILRRHEKSWVNGLVGAVESIVPSQELRCRACGRLLNGQHFGRLCLFCRQENLAEY